MNPSLLTSFRCRIMIGWSWRQTGRNWGTSKIKWGRLWPRTWPSELGQTGWKYLQAQLNQSFPNLMGPQGIHIHIHTPTFTLRREQNCRRAIPFFVRKKKKYIYIIFSLWFPWQHVGLSLFPWWWLARVLEPERVTEINTTMLSWNYMIKDKCDRTCSHL